MMQVAHVLIKWNEKNNAALSNELKSIKEIKHIEYAFGSYDAVIRLETESKNTIKQIMINKIRNIRGIQSTLTLVKT
ncbi:MAG: Lrp/AsnC ligand binding domain-containing protein [Nitrosopumilus sp.]|uniref:Lrp/AsnC ligand binding domain-containing protein n=1 Tax=Nitrosopumilus sp. TaxID=2024843 RepID=UPI00292EAD51|nr:Lrp/AsnC ligand binding domain-containing protein [Nitrosopumilus sp.]